MLSCVTRQAAVPRQRPKTAVEARPSRDAKTYRVVRLPEAGTLLSAGRLFLFGQFSAILYPGSRVTIYRRHRRLLKIAILTYYLLM